MIAVVSLLLVVFTRSLVEAAGIEAKVRCDDWSHIFVDGEKVGETSDWRDVWEETISGKSRLIAVRCRNKGSHGGLIVSVADRIVTNETWRCRNYTRSDDWYKPYTDDSSSPWNSAYVIPPDVKTWHTYGKFPEDAKWIWRDTHTEWEVTSLCRTEIGISVYMKCQDQGRVFADGGIMFTINSTNMKNIIPRTTHVVAIRSTSGEDDIAYILAHFSNGYRTDKSWRCTNKWYDGWKSVHYNDSHWDHAADYGPGDLDDVRKITTADMKSSNIYCRGHIECGCAHLCKEHENEYDFHCLCHEGFILGEDGFSCDEDECQRNNGGCEDVCINTFGSYKCECSVPGYELSDDNHSCVNIDECDRGTHNCTVGKICTDTEGSFNCVCPVGFELQQDSETGTCQDIDECLVHRPCDHECVNTVGSYICNCSDGYSLQDDHHTCAFSGDKMSGVSTSMIAGIVVAFLAISLVAILAVILLIRRRRNKKHVQKADTSLGYLPPVSRSFDKNGGENGGDSQPKELSHVYYNVGREMSETVETPYEEVDRVRIENVGVRMAGLEVIVLPTPPPTPIPHLKSESPLTSRSSPSPVGAQLAGLSKFNKNSDSESLSDLSLSNNSDDEVVEAPNDSTKNGADNIYYNVASEELLTKPIKVEELAEYVREMLEGDRFLEELEKLPSGQQGQCRVCNRPGIRKKLRFRDIKPYDHSIVALETIDEEPLSDFINASFVHGYRKQNFFIATQGPKPATLTDFWRMIWQHNVRIITMLTSCFESGNEKCCQYWPDNSVKTYGDIRVKTADIQISADFTVRTFMVEKGSEKRSVKHFHYTTWPDQGVPDDGTSLIALRRRIKEAEQASGPPVVVHCSAGVGRTGTYIALDYLMEQAEAERVVDVCRCVNLMRENRMNMIQTSLQYQFVHTTLLEAILVGHTSVPCSEFHKRLAMLNKAHPQTKKTGLQIQFKLLDTLKLPLENFTFKAAMLPENQVKNRDPTVYPADNQYLHLHPTEWTKEDYINAVFVDGYRTRREFIVTQMPLPNTKCDLWRLADDYKVSTVVMLNEADVNGEDIYFPSSDRSMTIGSVIVELKDTAMADYFVRRSLTVQTNSRTVSVTHINVTEWCESDPLKAGIPTLIALFKEVQKLKQKQTATGPVLVHCLNGVEKSGLFCAAYLMLDKINAESEVDVFNAVKKIRTDRPQFVTSEEQYNFLHDVAKEYIDSFDLYANFK